MKHRRVLPVLALSSALAFCPALWAQGHDTQHSAEPASPHHQGTPVQGAAHNESAHDSTTQAGHATGGHHGPEIKLFGTVLGPGAQYVIKLLNFAIFAGALVLMTKGALSAAFKARAQELEERLAQAAKEKAEGDAQVRDLEARMAGLQGELDEILSKAGSDAEGERVRILASARTEAEAILAQASAEIDFQRRQAEQELRALVAELAIEGATQRLQARMEGPAAATIVNRAIGEISQRAGRFQASSHEGGIQ